MQPFQDISSMDPSAFVDGVDYNNFFYGGQAQAELESVGLGDYIPNPLTATAIMPMATRMVMPSMSATAGMVNPTPLGTGLTPGSLTQPMPSIVMSAPVDIGPTCDPISQWIADNPLLAAGGLGLLAAVLWSRLGK